MDCFLSLVLVQLWLVRACKNAINDCALTVKGTRLMEGDVLSIHDNSEKLYACSNYIVYGISTWSLMACSHKSFIYR